MPPFLTRLCIRDPLGCPHAVARIIAGGYLLLGGGVLLAANHLLAALVHEPGTYHALQAGKDWFFIALTAVLLYLLIWHTVTRLAASELKRREGELQFKALVDGALVGVYVIQDGRFAYVNPAMARMHGHTESELLGSSSVLELIAPEDRARVEANIRRRISGEIPDAHYAFRIRRKDGRLVPVEVFGARAEFAGRPAVIGMALDNTQRDRLQAELLHSQRMEIVGRLAGGVAHDFNNILTAIMSLAELTAPTLAKDDPRRADQEEILQLSERAAAITKQLLAFSRRKLVDARPVELNALIRGAEPMLRRALGRGVALELALAPELARVSADPVQFEQVLLNLAVNARDAMPAGGALSITTFDADTDEPLPAASAPVPPGRYAGLLVRDTGTGMDAATLARVFEPFFTTKEEGKGTGLGLAVVHDILTQCGGHIAVDSAPGKGTAFRLYLPKCAEPSATVA